MDAGNYSSAHDLALIAQECWKHEIFRTVVGTATYQMPAAESHSEPYTILSSDAMINLPLLYTVPTVKGIKRVTQAAAATCLRRRQRQRRDIHRCGAGRAWDAAEDGYAYSFHDTATIYDWLFANYSIKPSIDTGSPVTEVKVNYSSEADTLMLYPAGTLRPCFPTTATSCWKKPSMCPKAWTLPSPWETRSAP